MSVRAHGAGLPLFVAGHGPHGVFALHGWGGSHHTFDPLLQHLEADHFRLWSVDLPGYGGANPPAEWSVGAYTDMIVEAIDRTEGRLTLLGNCSGAIFGCAAAIKRPERFDRIVLLDPFAYLPWYFALFLIPVLGRVAFWTTFANPIGRWLTNRGLARHRAESTDLTASFARVDPESAWQTLRLLGEIRTISGFAPLVLPTRVVFGENTFGAVQASIGMFSALWPHARTTRLRGVGHLPLVEAPAEVAAALST